jgi:type I restriction enzyme M protein
VDTFEEEAEIDLGAVEQEIASLESQLATVRVNMADHLKDLGL